MYVCMVVCMRVCRCMFMLSLYSIHSQLAAKSGPLIAVLHKHDWVHTHTYDHTHTSPWWLQTQNSLCVNACIHTYIHAVLHKHDGVHTHTIQAYTHLFSDHFRLIICCSIYMYQYIYAYVHTCCAPQTWLCTYTWLCTHTHVMIFRICHNLLFATSCTCVVHTWIRAYIHAVTCSVVTSE